MRSSFGKTVAPEVEDQLAHAEARVGGDVVRDLGMAARERAPLRSRRVERLGDVIHRRLVGDGECAGIAPLLLGEPEELVPRRAQLGGPERHGGIGAHRMPPVTVPRHPAERGGAVAPNPEAGAASAPARADRWTEAVELAQNERATASRGIRCAGPSLTAPPPVEIRRPEPGNPRASSPLPRRGDAPWKHVDGARSSPSPPDCERQAQTSSNGQTARLARAKP